MFRAASTRGDVHGAAPRDRAQEWADPRRAGQPRGSPGRCSQRGARGIDQRAAALGVARRRGGARAARRRTPDRRSTARGRRTRASRPRRSCARSRRCRGRRADRSRRVARALQEDGPLAPRAALGPREPRVVASVTGGPDLAPGSRAGAVELEPAAVRARGGDDPLGDLAAIEGVARGRGEPVAPGRAPTAPSSAAIIRRKVCARAGIAGSRLPTSGNAAVRQVDRARRRPGRGRARRYAAMDRCSPGPRRPGMHREAATRPGPGRRRRPRPEGTRAPPLERRSGGACGVAGALQASGWSVGSPMVRPAARHRSSVSPRGATVWPFSALDAPASRPRGRA